MEKITKRIKWGYAVADVGGNMFFTVVGFYLLFYLTDVAGIAPALAAMSILIGRIWGSATDLISGHISDITNTKWGGKRPYMVIGAVVSFFALGLLFTKPNLKDNFELFIYYTIIFCLMNTSYSLVSIPYTAMLPNISRDYDQRTVITGYRMSFAVIGTFIGSAMVTPVVSMFSSELDGWKAIGYIMGGIFLITSLITVFAVKEPRRESAKKFKGFIRNLRLVFSNEVYVLALIPWTLVSVALIFAQGVLPYYFKYVYNSEEMFNIAMLSFLSVALIFIPIWVTISKKLDKKYCYIIGEIIVSSTLLIYYFFGLKFGAVGASILIGFTGIGHATHYVMPFAILADSTEYDRALYGDTRREGILSGVWTFANKLGAALASVLIGFGLTLFGYRANSVPSESAINGIRFLGSLLPAIIAIAGLLLMFAYPITRKFYAKILSGNIEKTDEEEI